jgi:prevent-host-death family protein
MKTMTVSEARKVFARALESVVTDDEPLIIVRYRRPIAAIVPIDRVSPADRAASKREQRSDRNRRRR